MKRTPSPREVQVLNLMGDGMSNEEIAGTLEVQLNTIKEYTRRINAKLGTGGLANPRTAAVRQGMRKGWIR